MTEKRGDTHSGQCIDVTVSLQEVEGKNVKKGYLF
jgi:hypothetical protein